MTKKYIPGVRIWPPPRYPMIHKAREVFRSGGAEAVRAWSASLSPIEKGDLAVEIVKMIADASGRDPAEVALEIYFGKGFRL